MHDSAQATQAPPDLAKGSPGEASAESRSSTDKPADYSAPQPAVRAESESRVPETKRPQVCTRAMSGPVTSMRPAASALPKAQVSRAVALSNPGSLLVTLTGGGGRCGWRPGCA